MLTYNGVTDLAQWQRFVARFQNDLAKHNIKYCCAVLEATREGKVRICLMLQFRSDKERDTKAFYFEGLAPRADPNDLLGEGWGGRRVQDSYDRGFFYCWADKLGTVRDEANKLCVAGNYQPVCLAAEETMVV